MKKLLIIACLPFIALGCGKKEEVPPAPASSAAVSSTSAAPVASAAKPAASATSTFTGSYDAKQGEVRMPTDAPPFIHPEGKEGLGAGELTLTIRGDGPVEGKATGALGSQTFSGWLEGGKLTGTLVPEAGSPTMMWGFVDAQVEGSAVNGTMRASGPDGRAVRDAKFKLEKKG